MTESYREQKLRVEAERYRKTSAQRLKALEYYRARYLRKLVEPHMPWGLFEHMVGVENVMDDSLRIDVGELVVQINSVRALVPELNIQSVTRKDFADDDW